MSTALLTDRYELTMLDAALMPAEPTASACSRCSRAVCPRAGATGSLPERATHRAHPRVQVRRPRAAWLRHQGRASDALDWLADYRFRGTITGYREGELYFPGSPILMVDGTFAEAVLLETICLSVLNYDSAAPQPPLGWCRRHRDARSPRWDRVAPVSTARWPQPAPLHRGLLGDEQPRGRAAGGASRRWGRPPTRSRSCTTARRRPFAPRSTGWVRRPRSSSTRTTSSERSSSR